MFGRKAWDLRRAVLARISPVMSVSEESQWRRAMQRGNTDKAHAVTRSAQQRLARLHRAVNVMSEAQLNEMAAALDRGDMVTTSNLVRQTEERVAASNAEPPNTSDASPASSAKAR